MTEQSLMATLSGVTLTIFHPDTQSARAFAASLTGLGCRASHNWPLPAHAPTDAQLVVLVVEPRYQRQLSSLMSELKQARIPVIALADYQNISLFPLLLALKPSAILDRVINPFALMVQIIGTLEATRHITPGFNGAAYPQPVKAQRERLSKAKGLLMAEYGLDEPDAWRLMRSEAMNTRCSLEHTAARVINRLQKLAE